MGPPLTLHIPKDREAPDGAVTARQYISEGDGFTLIFTLPFKREDVYRELIAEKQLGVDHTNIQIQITRPGKTAREMAELEKRIGSAALSSQEAADVISHASSVSGGSPGLEVGCERTVTFPDGAIVSELVELEAPKMIRWKQLSSKRSTNMVGKEGGSLPEVTLALDELADGTSVRMTYDFYQIVQADGSVLDGPQMSKLLAQATQGWAADMRRRGYTPLSASADGSTPRGSSTPRSTVVRAAGQMKSDLEEERAMKEAMMKAAQEKMKS